MTLPQPSRSPEGGIAFCFFSFFFPLFFNFVPFSPWAQRCVAAAPVADPSRLLPGPRRAPLTSEALSPSRGAILTVGVAASRLKLAAPVH